MDRISTGMDAIKELSEALRVDGVRHLRSITIDCEVNGLAILTTTSLISEETIQKLKETVSKYNLIDAKHPNK